MAQLGIRLSRALIRFVIFWLLGIYVVRMFAGTFRQTLGRLWGLGFMLIYGALLWVVRWRAERSLGAVEKRWGYYAWWCVPTLVTIAPFVWKIVQWFSRENAPKGFLASAEASLGALFPVVLELGVPVILLAVVYFGLPSWAEKPPDASSGHAGPPT